MSDFDDANAENLKEIREYLARIAIAVEKIAKIE